MASFIALLVLGCGGGAELDSEPVSLSRERLSAVVQINSGGDDRAPFASDRLFSGGNSYSVAASIDTAGVANAASPAVYQSERYGDFSYRIAGLTPGSKYTVRLHFAEVYWSAAGKRVFNVQVNGTQVLSNFDIFAAVGQNKALVRDFDATPDADGQISVQYTSVVDNAKSSGLEVLAAESNNEPPTAPSDASATYRINSGGSAVASFDADQFFSGGATYSTSSAVSTGGVVNAAPAAVYQTERYGNHAYAFAGLTPNAAYLARLHFAEVYWAAAGQRVFNVSINGAQVLTDFDIFASCGGATACVRDFAASASADGRLLVEYRSVVDNAKSTAIEIIPVEGSDPVKPSDPVEGSDPAKPSDPPASDGSGWGNGEVDASPTGLNPTACAKPGGTPLGKASGTVGTWQNVTPQGVTLEPSMFNNDNFGVQDMLVNPARPSDAYTFICHQGVWKSTDYGATWKKINTGHNGALIDAGKPWGAGIHSNRCRDPNTPPTLYTLSGGGAQGFFKSVDGGVNWERVELPAQWSTQYPQDAYSIGVDPYAGGHLLMGFHEAVGLLESNDGGSTWQVRTPADNGVSVYFNFVDTGDPVTTAKTWLSVGQSGATFRTADAGATWRRVEQLTHAHGSSQIFQAGNGVIYVPGSNGSEGNGVYRSTDYGITFRKVLDGPANNVIGTPTTLYSSYAWANAGTVDPNLHTAPRQLGTAWASQAVPAGMTNGAKGAAVTSDGTHHIVLSGNWNAGIWRYIEP